ncbi:MAG: FixH family protein [Gemmatimonadales bacterium]
MKVRAALWPMAIIGVLAVTVGANGYLLYEANRGMAAIEPDYYQKAVAFDSTMAQARRNATLGWRVVAALDAGGTLTATIADSAGQPVTPGRFAVEAFPIAYEDGTVAATLTETGPGQFTAALPLRHAGLHEFRFEADVDTLRFTAVFRGEPGRSLSPKS